MTGPLITMMGKFLSTLNQSAMIQNTLMCTERTTSLSMIQSQSEAQVAEGQATAMASLLSGITGIIGGAAGVAGGIAGFVGAVGTVSDLSSLSAEGEASVDLEETAGSLGNEEDGVEMDELDTEGKTVEPKETNEPSTTDEETEVDEAQAKNEEGQKAEALKTKRALIEANAQKFKAITELSQSASQAVNALGQAAGSSYTTQAAQYQAQATVDGGLAQSVNSMMSGTESNYQSTMSLNTQLANGMFQAFTSWWGASSGR
ncbi:MAG TPA: hypothetical protein VIJ46_02940 [Rhabdochlamydiaceae bacterium]